MKVSAPQNFISSRGGVYCEEMLFVVGLQDSDIWGNHVPLNKREYLSTPHIDAMKVRLLSPCAKEHEGADEPNPAIGKARQMHGMLSWLGGGFEALVPLVSRRWEDRMGAFLPPDSWSRYLPVSLGGIQIPAYHRSTIDMVEIFRAMPEDLMLAIGKILSGTAPRMLRRVVSSFATSARQRGVSEDLIDQQIRETLQQADLVKGKSGEEIRILSGVSVSDWTHMRFQDKVNAAKRCGYITVDDAVSLIGRPYLFRDMIFPEVSKRHGIDPYATRQYEALPWNQRCSRFLSNVSASLGERVTLSCEEKSTICEKLAKWAVEKAQLDLPREEYFLPESVVVSEQLCTLRTALHVVERKSGSFTEAVATKRPPHAKRVAE